MKKCLVIIASFLISLEMFAGDISGFSIKKMDEKAHVGLFMGFSGVDSKFKNSDVEVEIYNEALWITNLTNKTVYLDLAQCFAYYNDDPQCLYVPDKARKGNTVITETQLINIAPGATKPLCGLGTQVGGVYSAYEGKDVRVVTEKTSIFMGIVDELRIQFEEGQLNCACKHLTEDESPIRLKAAIAYSFEKDCKDATPVVISTWLSDIVLAKYFTVLPAQQEKTKSLAAKKVLPARVCVTADTPFEYEEEKSPIMSYDIEIALKKGRFSLSPVVTREVKTNFLRILGSIYTAGLISPISVDNKNQFHDKVIQWLGPNVDFTKIEDDKKGSVTFGDKKSNPITVTNK